jgi:hypothetical protein
LGAFDDDAVVSGEPLTGSTRRNDDDDADDAFAAVTSQSNKADEAAGRTAARDFEPFFFSFLGSKKPLANMFPKV